MLSYFRNSFLILCLIFILSEVNAQEQTLRNSLNLSLWGNASQDDNQYTTIEIGHEWKPFSYLGLELGGGLGWFKGSDLFEDMFESGVYQQIYLKEVDGNYQLAKGKINAYLPLWRNDDEQIRLQIFGSLVGGFASIQLDGRIEVSESGAVVTNSADSDAHFFTGFELGAWLSFSERFAMKLSIGDTNIRFSQAIREMNEQINDFPLRYNSPVKGFNTALTLLFTYPQKKKR